MNIGIAAREDQAALRALWLQSFDDTEEAVDAFFARRFRPEDCLVCKKGGEVLSALYLLPSALLHAGGALPAHYIYAAATRPDQRGRGLMGRLLGLAAEVGPTRGEHFSFLLPASGALYDYYAKFGYAEFFSVEEVAVGADRLRRFAGRACPDEGAFSAASVARLRARLLEGREGAAVWGEEALAYAHRMNRIYKGNTLCIPGGYALCRRLENGAVEITELMAEKESVKDLLRLILRRFPGQMYRFRLPCGQNILPFPGEQRRFGMIRPLARGNFPFESMEQPPYLGLTLD